MQKEKTFSCSFIILSIVKQIKEDKRFQKLSDIALINVGVEVVKILTKIIGLVPPMPNLIFIKQSQLTNKLPADKIKIIIAFLPG